MQIKTGKNVTPESVTKPYPGWVVSCRVNDTTTILTGYLGAVTPRLGVLLMTEERPDMAAYILSNLKVIPKTQEVAALTQSVASSLK